MAHDVAAAICASACCVGSWAAMAGGAGWLVERRVRKVEAELGRRAVPPEEHAALFYAGASTVWLAAMAMAAYGLLKREHARLGRNAYWILVAHFSLATLGACGIVVAGDESPLPIVVMACLIVAGSFCMALGFAWRWSGVRRDRIAAEPPTGLEPPGPERWAVWIGSAVAWPVGFVALLVFREAERVGVGTTAARLSLGQIALVALGVCLALPILVAASWPP